MASPISTPAVFCSSSIRTAKPSEQSTRRFASTSNQFSQLGQFYLTSWTGLRNTTVTVSPKIVKSGKKERCRGLTVRASLFGVGAPEALVIGVVALLVFGPKGLAEVARNLGKTLRAFQPTIRELQDVSREFKTSLEREIGLDDIPSSSQTSYRSNSASSVPSPTISSNESPQNLSDPNGGPPNRAYSSEEYLKITEEQLKASVSVQDKVTNSPEDGQTYDDSQAFAQEAADDKPLLPNSESKA